MRGALAPSRCRWGDSFKMPLKRMLEENGVSCAECGDDVAGLQKLLRTTLKNLPSARQARAPRAAVLVD